MRQLLWRIGLSKENVISKKARKAGSSSGALVMLYEYNLSSSSTMSRILSMAAYLISFL